MQGIDSVQTEQLATLRRDMDNMNARILTIK
jgi:hypothetical protein